MTWFGPKKTAKLGDGVFPPGHRRFDLDGWPVTFDTYRGMETMSVAELTDAVKNCMDEIDKSRAYVERKMFRNVKRVVAIIVTILFLFTWGFAAFWHHSDEIGRLKVSCEYAKEHSELVSQRVDVLGKIRELTVDLCSGVEEGRCGNSTSDSND